MIPAVPDELKDTPDLRKIVATTSEADACLGNLIEKDPAAAAELRRLLAEGLESGEEGEVNDEWWASLAASIRERAAARSR